MGREGRDYWEEQLSEYWDSGLTIQEYSELKELLPGFGCWLTAQKSQSRKVLTALRCPKC